MHLTLPRKRIHVQTKKTMLRYHHVISNSDHKLGQEIIRKLMGGSSRQYVGRVLQKMVQAGVIKMDDSGPIILYYSHIPNAVVKEELGL
jgi:CRP-like cAMP-binding protein